MFHDGRLDKASLGVLSYCLHAQEEKEKISMAKLGERFIGRGSLKRCMGKLFELGYAVRFPEKKPVPRGIVYKFFETPLTEEEANLYLDRDEE